MEAATAYNLLAEIRQSDKTWGMLSPLNQRKPKYLIIPDESDSVSYVREGLTAYSALNKEDTKT